MVSLSVMMTNREFKDFAKMAVAVAALLLLILIGNLFGFHEDRQSVHIRWALGSATLFVLPSYFRTSGWSLQVEHFDLAVLGVVNLIIHPTRSDWQLQFLAEESVGCYLFWPRNRVGDPISHLIAHGLDANLQACHC